MAVTWEKTKQESAANATKPAPSTDLTSKQKPVQLSESIPRSNQNPGLSDFLNHTEIMTANYHAQLSVCLFTEFPRELCTLPSLNSKITNFQFFHAKRKTLAVSTWAHPLVLQIIESEMRDLCC